MTGKGFVAIIEHHHIKALYSILVEEIGTFCGENIDIKDCFNYDDL